MEKSVIKTGSKHKSDTISIHAPLWGVTTEYEIGKQMPVIISIHAPLWGATRIYVTDELGYIFDFNPRTLVGCDNHIL